MCLFVYLATPGLSMVCDLGSSLQNVESYLWHANFSSLTRIEPRLLSIGNAESLATGPPRSQWVYVYSRIQYIIGSDYQG